MIEFFKFDHPFRGSNEDLISVIDHYHLWGVGNVITFENNPENLFHYIIFPPFKQITILSLLIERSKHIHALHCLHFSHPVG